MKLRKLRIAWSATWAVVAVLLCVLWVRSRYIVDQIVFPISPRYVMGLGSTPGVLGVGVADKVRANPPGRIFQSADEWLHLNSGDGLVHSRLRGEFYLNAYNIGMPYWLWCLIAAGLVFVPYVKRRFSFRTLLLALTVVSAVLGLAVWAMRG
jgi:hypothetical protein